MKMKNTKRKEVARLLARAVALQAMRWDVETEIEAVIGHDLGHSEDFIKYLAISVDAPGYDVKITAAQVAVFLKDQGDE